MAINAEQLNIILAARDKEFTKAMDRANRRVENFARKSQSNLSKTSRAFNGLGAVAGKLGVALSAGAVATGFVSAIDNATKMAQELTNLSRVAGTTVERFQEISFATRSMGISQEKLSDILKDVNDKFGDFAATGAGPLADFFENIAPKVGVTADDFARLSSDQALGLYVKTLQEAGVNQQELTFYMEALASDATALAPLFLNNAENMNEMAKAARDLGAVIDEDLINKSAQLRRRWDEVMTAMGRKFSGFALTVVNGFDAIFNLSESEQLNELVEQYDRIQEERGRLSELMRQTVQTFPEGDRRDNIMAGITADMAEQDALLNANLAAQAAINDNLVKRMELEGTMNDLLNQGGSNLSTVADNAGKATQELKLMGEAMDDLESIAGTLERGLEDVFMSALDGAESFEDTMKNTASAIIKELYRVLVVQRMVNAAMGFFGVSPAPIGGGGGGRASGGPVQAGQAYTVGEHGRELFVPQTAGRILSVPQTKAAMSGGGDVVVNQTINVSTGVQQTVRTEIKSLMPQIAESAKAAVADAKRRGGSYGRAFA